MLNKIMYKGDMFFPDLIGKKIKAVHKPILCTDADHLEFDSWGECRIGGNLTEKQTVPEGTVSTFLIAMDWVVDDNHQRIKHTLFGVQDHTRYFDWNDYIQNGGVLSRLLNHLYHWLGGVCYG